MDVGNSVHGPRTCQGGIINGICRIGSVLPFSACETMGIRQAGTRDISSDNESGWFAARKIMNNCGTVEGVQSWEVRPRRRLCGKDFQSVMCRDVS
jgi:hypothetical protein